MSAEIRLRVHGLDLETEAGDSCGFYTYATIPRAAVDGPERAAELARRWNAHQGLVDEIARLKAPRVVVENTIQLLDRRPPITSEEVERRR